MSTAKFHSKRDHPTSPFYGVEPKPDMPANRLQTLTMALRAVGIELAKARNEFLRKEASRDNFRACLIRDSSGKSMAEREMMAKASESWLLFHQELATLESDFEFLKLKWKVLEKEWLAEYLEAKLDDSSIKKGL